MGVKLLPSQRRKGIRLTPRRGEKREIAKKMRNTYFALLLYKGVGGLYTGGLTGEWGGGKWPCLVGDGEEEVLARNDHGGGKLRSR